MLSRGALLLFNAYWTVASSVAVRNQIAEYLAPTALIALIVRAVLGLLMQKS